MTYSSAVFNGEPYGSDEDLADAQRRKIDRLLDAAAVGTDTRLLEIGTGWGELAIRAARRGAHVTTADHLDRAGRTRPRAGRSATGSPTGSTCCCATTARSRGSYDAVVSVEMIEAVGANHWPTYFRTIDQVLAPGGRVGLQAILQDDYTVLATRDTYTWIRKYIFPGGQLASVEAIERTLGGHTSLRIADRYSFGRHYAETLRRWRATFEEHWHGGRGPRLRRDVPPDVVAVPRLLRGGLPHRLPRRRAADADQALTPLGRPVPDARRR